MSIVRVPSLAGTRRIGGMGPRGDGVQEEHRFRLMIRGDLPGFSVDPSCADIRARPAAPHLAGIWYCFRLSAISVSLLFTRKFTVPSSYVPSDLRSPAGTPVRTSIPSSMVRIG